MIVMLSSNSYSLQARDRFAWLNATPESRFLFAVPSTVRQLVIQLSRVRSTFCFQDHGDALVTNTFERVNTKFWVPGSAVTALKLAILRELPIFEIAHRTPDVELDLEARASTTGDYHNFVSSVYLDTPELTCYHQRVQRLHGAYVPAVTRCPPSSALGVVYSG